MPRVPSVATKGGMPSIATSQPLSTPNAAPKAQAASRPSTIEPVASTVSATISDASVSTAPIDRSRPSVMMISVIGSASSSSTVDCTSTLEMLAPDRKPGAANANRPTSTTSMTATPGTRPIRVSGEATATSDMVHPQPHDVFFGQLLARQLADDAA